MASQLVPEDFDWVTGRANCSLPQMFKKLQMSIAADVEVRNNLISPANRQRLTFSFVNGSGNRFSVIREEYVLLPVAPTSRSVDFVMSNGAISVSEEGTAFLSATVTLNKFGRCVYKVGEEELEVWELRRKALEKLFFDPSKPINAGNL
jgi:hypothetical protein